MSILRIKELELQLHRRDARIADIETKINNLYRYEPSETFIGMSIYSHADWLYRDHVLECFK